MCVDATNAFMHDHYTLPKLLDMCAQGWVNNILYTGTAHAAQVRSAYKRALYGPPLYTHRGLVEPEICVLIDKNCIMITENCIMITEKYIMITENYIMIN